MLPSRIQRFRSFYKQLTTIAGLLIALPLLTGAKQEHPIPAADLESELRQNHHFPNQKLISDRLKLKAPQSPPHPERTMDKPKPPKRKAWWIIPEELEDKAFAYQVNKQHIILTDKESGSALVAQWMVTQLNERDRQGLPTTFGLATGSSPISCIRQSGESFSGRDIQNRQPLHHQPGMSILA